MNFLISPLPHMYMCFECVLSNKFYFRFYFIVYNQFKNVHRKVPRNGGTPYTIQTTKQCVACVEHVAWRVHIYSPSKGTHYTHSTQYMVVTHTHSLHQPSDTHMHLFLSVHISSFVWIFIYTLVHLYPLFNVSARCSFASVDVLVLVCKFWKCCTPYVH